jgi:hypothetical protein
MTALIGEGRHVALVGTFHDSDEMRKEVEKQVRKSSNDDKLLKRLERETFGNAYQRWYSRALPVVKQLLPERYDEFREFHRLDRRAKELDVASYTISDYIQGFRVTKGWSDEPVFDPGKVALGKLNSQVDILESVEQHLDSLLADITGVLEADLLDDEIARAQELLKAKYLRAGGIVAGVVLERHLKRLMDTHNVALRKVPQIASMNDALKQVKVYDVPQWRQIQRLGDLRNICAHHGEREPTTDEIAELISGIQKVVATVF